MKVLEKFPLDWFGIKVGFSIGHIRNGWKFFLCLQSLSVMGRGSHKLPHAITERRRGSCPPLHAVAVRERLREGGRV